MALPSNSKTWLERVSKDKPSILLGLVIVDEGKKFYNIATCGLYYKQVMIVIYDRNDIGLYYKTRDNRNWQR